MRLAIDPRSAVVRLTLPPRASLARGLAWAEAKRGWVEAQLAAMPQPRPIVPGMRFCLGGDDVMLDWRALHPRRFERAGDRLIAGGPLDTLATRLLRWLRSEALRVLDEETVALAVGHGITVRSVRVGDPRGRWGSCAASGDIRYSWRLILAPADVRRATVAHEVAHRVHMNHGAAFHALVRVLAGEDDPTAARAWLKRHGAALHWFGASVSGGGGG